MTEAEASIRTGLAASTLQKQRVRGDGIPYVKIGRSVRYDSDVVDEWLDARTVSSTSQAIAS
ncbi:helix-turn-helix transcriptional regulator [Sphingomicrobium clamense]